MARKTLQTSDGKHVQLGEDDHFTTSGLPMTPSGDAAVCSNWFGRIMDKDSGGFGSAYVDEDDY